MLPNFFRSLFSLFGCGLACLQAIGKSIGIKGPDRLRRRFHSLSFSAKSPQFRIPASGIFPPRNM